MSLELLLYITIALLAIIIVLMFTKKDNHQHQSLSQDIHRMDHMLRQELGRSREESLIQSKELRTEINQSLKDFTHQMSQMLQLVSDAQRSQLNTFSTSLHMMNEDQDKRFKNLMESIEHQLISFKNNWTSLTNQYHNNLTISIKNQENRTEKLIFSFSDLSRQLQETLTLTAQKNREELSQNLKSFEEKFSNSFLSFNDQQKQNFKDLINKQEQVKLETEHKLEKIRETVEHRLRHLQEDNAQKIEIMRQTVDEKLQSTLEKRLNDSFTIISERLELVHKGLGEMQTLANSVGDIKKVMTNVKSRGILGEYQLANILEDLLTNDQYEKNVKTKSNSGAIVEFAIKMPNNNDLHKTLWLPIDSKFPKEDYESLVDAYEEGDIIKIEEWKKSFKNAIIKNAKDIKEKYLDPPNTTEYGIMFLPFESLYAEVLRTPGLFELIQKEYKVTVTGPTTLSALLSSLQMGFRTLAIEKRSSEVWNILGAVKTEFGKFGTILERTKKKLQEATNTIEQAGVRSRVIERQLKNVESSPIAHTTKTIDNNLNWENSITDADEEFIE